DLGPRLLRIAPDDRVPFGHRPHVAVADVQSRDLPGPEARVGPRLATGQTEHALARADQQLGRRTRRSAGIAHPTTIPRFRPTTAGRLRGVAVAVVRLAGDARSAAGDLLHDGEALTLGDQLVDLGVLVVGGDREPRRIATDGLVLEPRQVDPRPAGRVAALAHEVLLDLVLERDCPARLGDPLVPVARTRFVSDLLFPPVAHDHHPAIRRTPGRGSCGCRCRSGADRPSRSPCAPTGPRRGTRPRRWTRAGRCRGSRPAAWPASPQPGASGPPRR